MGGRQRAQVGNAERIACIGCHKRPGCDAATAVWAARPLSYPRHGYAAADRRDGRRQHLPAPRVALLSAQERHGERTFLANCAFGHGADGSGCIWIGSFLEPHPRNLADPAWKDVLAAKDIGAVVAYIARVFFPLQP